LASLCNGLDLETLLVVLWAMVALDATYLEAIGVLYVSLAAAETCHTSGSAYR